MWIYPLHRNTGEVGVQSLGEGDVSALRKVGEISFLHAGKPTATITSVLLEVSDADGGS